MRRRGIQQRADLALACVRQRRHPVHLGRPTKVFLGISFVLLASVSQATYRIDERVLPPPNYDTFVPPALSKVYKDPAFGTMISRMTDALKQGSVLLTPEYSSSDLFNADESMVRLTGNDVSFVSTRPPYQLLRRRSIGSATASDYWWDVNDPNVMYHIYQGNSISAYHYDTDQDQVVRTFTQFSFLRALGEDNLSVDGNRLALWADNRYVFIYEFSSDSIVASLDTYAPPLGGKAITDLTTTPSGDGVIIGWALPAGPSRAQGEEFFRVQGGNLLFQRQLSQGVGHHDVGQDSTGTDYLVIAHETASTKDLVAVRTSDGRATHLATLGGGGFWHDVLISCNSMHNDDYVYFATYKEQEIPLAIWTTWVSELLRVKVSGGPIERIAHHRSRPHDSYWSTPKVSISRSGRYLVFPSNFNRQANEWGIPNNYVDTYIIDAAMNQWTFQSFQGEDTSP
jgi:hypothetical protein